MRRFFVEPDQLKNQTSIDLAGDEFHHLKVVCRLEEGERVELLDGEGHLALATITTIGKKTATLTVEKVESLPPLPKPEIEIVLCVPRFQKMDLIIQKSVELGAAKIIPVVSDRSFVKKMSPDLSDKVQRWQKIALEACKQSGRAWPMKIENFGRLEEQIKKTPKESALFLYEGGGTLDIKAALAKITRKLDRITLFIGAEGGFSVEEVKSFVDAGMQPVTLGELVLRVETACIAILSVIQYDFGNMR